jgi:hypothetical protein
VFSGEISTESPVESEVPETPEIPGNQEAEGEPPPDPVEETIENPEVPENVPEQLVEEVPGKFLVPITVQFLRHFLC